MDTLQRHELDSPHSMQDAEQGHSIGPVLNIPGDAVVAQFHHLLDCKSTSTMPTFVWCTDEFAYLPQLCTLPSTRTHSCCLSTGLGQAGAPLHYPWPVPCHLKLWQLLRPQASVPTPCKEEEHYVPSPLLAGNLDYCGWYIKTLRRWSTRCP